MPNPTESQIKERIQAFVSELDRLVRRSTLDALRGVLEGSAAPVRRSRPGTGRGPGRPPASGSSADLPAKITAQVRSSPGQTVGEIVTAVGGKPASVKKTIKSMLDAGDLRKAGQKRGTRYFPPGPGRLPGTVVKRAKRAKRRPAKKVVTRKTKRSSSPKKRARKATRSVRRSSRMAVIVPAPKPRLAPLREGTMVPHHLDPHHLETTRPVLAVAK